MAQNKGFFHYLFRLLLGLSLIALGIKSLYSIDSNHGFVSQNIRLISELLQKPSLAQYRELSPKVILVESYLYIMSGILLIMGASLAKFTAFLAIVIELGLVHNPYFYKERKYKTLNALYLGIFGAVLNN